MWTIQKENVSGHLRLWTILPPSAIIHIELDGTPPDDLSDFSLHLRARTPANEDQQSIYTKVYHQKSDGIDSMAESSFEHQLLVNLIGYICGKKNGKC